MDFYISITGHFISSDFKQKSIFISCFKTMKIHTSQNLKDDICEVLNKWDLSSKVTCILSDNAANIVAAIKKTGWPQLSCLAHTLHLIVMDALKIDIINEILVKCKSAAEYFNRSTKAYNKLKEIQKQMEKRGLKMINATPTRWNSTLKMLERLVENQEPLEATIAILHNPISLFSLGEWELIKKIIAILQPFNEITVEMSGETYTTISKVLVLVQSLQTFLFKKQNVETDTNCCMFIEKLLTNINQRFQVAQYNEIYSISSFLDPRFKLKSFTDESALNICKDKIITLLGNFRTDEIEFEELVDDVLNETSIWEDFDKTSNTHKRTPSEIDQYVQEDLLELFYIHHRCNLKST